MFNIYVTEKMLEYQKEKLKKVDRYGWQYNSRSIFGNYFKSLTSLFTKHSQPFKQHHTQCCSCHSC